MAKEEEPKGRCPANDNGSHSGEPLDPCIRRINERPRETLQFETPAERFNACVAATGWAGSAKRPFGGISTSQKGQHRTCSAIVDRVEPKTLFPFGAPGEGPRACGTIPSPVIDTGSRFWFSPHSVG